MLPDVYEVRSKQQQTKQVPDTVSFWKWYMRYDFFSVIVFRYVMSEKFAQ